MNILIAAALWKWIVIPLVVVAGIIGFLLRTLVDAAENFETGYGSGSKRAMRQGITVLVISIGLAILIGIFGGCAFIKGVRQFDAAGDQYEIQTTRTR